MSFYVLKYIGPYDVDHKEHFYDESVPVKNRIALVQKEYNKNQLLGRNFIELGIVNSEDDVPLLLGQKDVTVEVTKEPNRKIVSLDSILPEEDSNWYSKL